MVVWASDSWANSGLILLLLNINFMLGFFIILVILFIKNYKKSNNAVGFISDFICGLIGLAVFSYLASLDSEFNFKVSVILILVLLLVFLRLWENSCKKFKIKQE